jgi:hypothetical protein
MAKDPALSGMKIALVEIQNLLNSVGNQASSSR